MAEAKLLAGGVTTLGALLDGDRFPELRAYVEAGIDGRQAAPLGDDRPAFREHDEPNGPDGSISNERTFFADLSDVGRVEDALRALAERVAWRARRRQVRARTVTLKLRYADFDTHTHGLTGPATDAESDVIRTTRRLLSEAWTRRVAIRLIGVQLSNFEPPERQLLLPFGPRRPRLGPALDAVRDRFGFDAVRVGTVAAPRREPRGEGRGA